MTFHVNVFVAAVAIGALAELITLRYSTKYEQWTAAGKVIMVSGAIALLPAAGAWWAIGGLLIARVGDVFGGLVHELVVFIAIWWDRKWDTSQSRQAELPERLTTE